MNRETVQPEYLPPGQGNTLWVLGGFIIYKTRGGDATTTVFEELLPPETGGPAHFHHAQDESFYILEGTYEFILDGRRVEAGPGCFIHVPRRTVHSLKNIGTTMGRTLVSISPGGLMHFFDDVGIPVADRAAFRAPAGPPDMDRVLASARRNQLEILP